MSASGSNGEAAARALRDWACARLGIAADDSVLEALPGDASFRRYLRLRAGGRSWMLCVAPPEREKNAEFVAVRGLLERAGVRVPALHDADLQRGWLLLEDLGDALLLPALRGESLQRVDSAAPSHSPPSPAGRLSGAESMLEKSLQRVDSAAPSHSSPSPAGRLSGAESTSETRVDRLYEEALDMLLALAQAVPALPGGTSSEARSGAGRLGSPGEPEGVETVLPVYDTARLQQELDLFPQWFEQGLLGLPATAAGAADFERLCALLHANALAQPQVLVHRDFHSRNLMFAPGGELATIDFQDAVVGPLTYDLVSLLKDCYIAWPAPAVRRWALRYRAECARVGLPVGEDEQVFLRWFDLMGLQRHLKVLGIFARLHLRDGKSAYLDDLPRVLAYVQAVLVRYGQEEPLAALGQRFERDLWPRIRRQSWYHAP
jgi:aminoglycoside/choline kinase family phosphotransferase